MSFDTIRAHCKTLRLPTVAQVVDQALVTAQQEDWALETFLEHLLEQELAGRRERRIARLTKAAHFPAGKTLETFDQRRLPLRIRRQIPQLCQGDLHPPCREHPHLRPARHRQNTPRRRLGL